MHRRGGSKPSGSGNAMEPATTIKLPTTTVNAGDVRLGPGAPRKAWGDGSKQAQPVGATAPGGNATPMKDPRVNSKQQIAMTKQGSGGAWRSGSGGSDAQRSDWSGRSGGGGGGSGGGTGTQSDKSGAERAAPPASLASRVASREQPEAAAAGQSGASSSEASRDATPDRRASVPVGVNATLTAAARLAETAQHGASERHTENVSIGTGPALDEATVAQRAQRLFGEYVESGGRLSGPAVGELEETSRAQNLDAFVTALVNESFEQRGSERDDNNARRSCGRLLAEMWSRQLVNGAMFTKG